MERAVDVALVLFVVSISHNLLAWWFWKRSKHLWENMRDLRESTRDLLIATQKLVDKENV